MITLNYYMYMHIKDTPETFNNDKYITLAMVNDFIDRANKEGWNDKITILESITDESKPTSNFMDFLKKKDKRIYDRTNYQILPKISITFPHVKAHYIISNGLLNRLPAKIYTLKNGHIYDIQTKRYSDKGYDDVASIAYEFLFNIPLGYHIIINDYAMQWVKNMKDVLVKGGYVDIFGHGFMNINLPVNAWNQSLKKLNEKAGSRIYSINFILMQSYARSIDLKCYVETLDDYVHDAFGIRLYPVKLKHGLYYMTKNEMNIPKNKIMLKKMGYDDAYLSGRFMEPNNYYHMRIWK